MYMIVFFKWNILWYFYILSKLIRFVRSYLSQKKIPALLRNKDDEQLHAYKKHWKSLK